MICFGGKGVVGLCNGVCVLDCIYLVSFGQEVCLYFEVVLKGLEKWEGCDNELEQDKVIRGDFEWGQVGLCCGCYDCFFSGFYG